jgi:hypothetical protein
MSTHDAKSTPTGHAPGYVDWDVYFAQRARYERQLRDLAAAYLREADIIAAERDRFYFR